METSKIKTPSLPVPKIMTKTKTKEEKEEKPVKKEKYLDQLYSSEFIRKYFNEK